MNSVRFKAGNIYHVFNQGNNQQTIFRCAEDYLIFLRLVRKLISPNTEILAWCLMPNHFHFLLYTTQNGCERIKQGGIEIEKLTNGIRKLLSGYARIFNSRYTQSGSLFRQKTKAKNVAESDWVVKNNVSLEDYCSSCFSYIHQNPVIAALVKDAAAWEWSSYKDYAGLRNGSLCNQELAAKYCRYHTADFIRQTSIQPGDELIQTFLRED